MDSQIIYRSFGPGKLSEKITGSTAKVTHSFIYLFQYIRIINSIYLRISRSIYISIKLTVLVYSFIQWWKSTVEPVLAKDLSGNNLYINGDYFTLTDIIIGFRYSIYRMYLVIIITILFRSISIKYILLTLISISISFGLCLIISIYLPVCST